MNTPLIITVGSNQGLRTDILSAEEMQKVTLLNRMVYRSIFDDASGTYIPPCSYGDEVVELCEYSEYSGYILESDAEHTEDGWAYSDEDTISDKSEYYENPILRSRKAEYNMVRLHDGGWASTDSDHVFYGYVSSGHQDYYLDWNGDDTVRDEHDNYYRESYIAEDMGLSYNERSGCYSKRPIYKFDYHQGSDTDKRSKTDVWSFGVEIEKEDEDVLESAYAQELLDDTGWIKESDGSLDSDSGYELCSPIYELHDLSALQKDLQNKDIVRHINADYSDSCGGHFNVSHQDYTSKEIYEGFTGYFPLLYALYPSRVNASYCEGKCKYNMGSSPNKYSAFYQKNSKVLEIRLFPAYRNVENLLWRIELVQIMTKYINYSEDQVLRMIANRKSKLHMLLRKMYNKVDADNVDSRILDLCTRFVQYARSLNNKNLTPTLRVIQNRNNKAA